MAIGVAIDRDGTSVWVFDRCGGKTCDGSNIAPIQKFDASGRLVVSFGSGLFSWPHGLFAAPDGTIWVTDGRNQTVMHFAPDGRLLMTLGKPGVAGDGPDTFNSPSDVVVAPERRHLCCRRPRRLSGAEDERPHGQVFQRRQIHQGLGPPWIGAGRLRRAPRACHGFRRPALCRRPGEQSHPDIRSGRQAFWTIWKQFGRPSGIYIRNNILYVGDSQSDDKTNPPFRQGIRIGSVKDGKVTVYIPPIDPKISMPEGVAADKDGNVFGGFATGMDFKKFAKN